MNVKELRTGRALVAAAVVIGLAMALMMIGSEPRAWATHVAPRQVDSNANCSGLTGIEELARVENPSDGSRVVVIDGVSYTIRWDVHADNTFDWSTSGGLAIYAVFVKGGSGGGGNLYDYRPGGAIADTGLHALVNPNGNYAGLSHISFCGDVENPTTTTTTSTTSTTTTTTTTTTTIGTSDSSSTTQATTTTAKGPTSSVGTSDSTVSTETSATASSAPSSSVAAGGQNLTTSTSIEDEVLGISFLPFTGYWFEEYGTLALALVAAGLLALVAARSLER